MLPLPKGLGNRVVSVRRETVSFRIKFKIYQTTLISVLIKIIQSNKYFETKPFPLFTDARDLRPFTFEFL